jgi:sugar phosphate permease
MQPLLSKARWLRITPIIFITYSFAYLDRVNYSFAAAGGIARDLKISAGTSALIGAIFFLGYFAAQIPGAIYADRRSPRRIICASLILWGVLSALTGLVGNVSILLIVRFLLGAVEAAVFPALLIFVSRWFARSERSLANSFIILSTPVTILWMSIVSGYLVSAFGWRWMFVAEGLPASIWGVLWWVLVQDQPAEAKWLSAEDRVAIEAKILTEQVGIAAVRNYMEAFTSPTVIRLTVLYFFWGLSLFGFILWLPTIIKAAGSATIIATGWLSAGPYVVATLLMPVISIISDRVLDRRRIVWPCLAISAAGFFGLYLFKNAGFGVAYPLLCVAGIGPIVALAPFFCIPADILPKNVAGGASALINSMGALGGFVGSYLVGMINGLTGDKASSFLLMGVSLAIAAGLMMLPTAKARVAASLTGGRQFNDEVVIAPGQGGGSA